jgi:hypothetical protein
MTAGDIIAEEIKDGIRSIAVESQTGNVCCLIPITSLSRNKVSETPSDRDGSVVNRRSELTSRHRFQKYLRRFTKLTGFTQSFSEIRLTYRMVWSVHTPSNRIRNGALIVPDYFICVTSVWRAVFKWHYPILGWRLEGNLHDGIC